MNIELMLPYIWLAVVVVMSIVEVCTVQFVSIWFVIGALAALIVSVFSPSATLQTIVFIIVTLLMLFLTRPIVKKFLDFKKEDTNAGRFIGKTGFVTQTINNEFGEGLVNVSGSMWTARSIDSSVIKEGENVIVKSIEGVKLIVKKV